MVMAMMADVPKLDEKGQPVMTNVPVMVDQRVEEQAIVQGPMASQVAIKMLGTNGGGYTNANAAHPFENPTPALQLPPDALHLRHRQRADLLPRAHGEEPGPRLVGLGGDDGLVPGRGVPLLAFGSGRQSDSSPAWQWPPRAGTWKARKCASASSIPPCSPR
jgi:hypothetical protein